MLRILPLYSERRIHDGHVGNNNSCALQTGIENCNAAKNYLYLECYTFQHNEDAKRLLTLMGVPFTEAPCEAEAQCAELVKSGKVFAAATEDMDCLTFGAPILLRHMTFSEAR